MARDFRPKSARGNEAKKSQPQKAQAPQKERKPPTKSAKSKDSQGSSSSDEDEEGLMKEIRALGGDEEDLALVRKKSKGVGGDDDGDDDEGQEDPDLSSDVLSFMKGLDFKAAGVETPKLETIKDAKKGKEEKRKTASVEQASKEVKATKSDAAGDTDKGKPEKALKKKEKPEKEAEEEKKARKAKEREEKSGKETGKGEKARKEESKEAKVEKKREKGEEGKSRRVSEQASFDERAKQGLQGKTAFVLEPTPRWSEIDLPALQVANKKAASADEIASLQQRGTKLLDSEKTLYGEMTRSGNGIGPGMLSSSDARFISELLGPGSKGGTLSDRVAALTLLAQSSPVHNVDAMESLLAMAGKKGREESGRATRALADWLASGGGLSERKLRYFSDHPSASQLVHFYQSPVSTNSKQRQLADGHLLLATFEDRLKRFYFQFLQVLETQSHDTLPFVRKQAVTQIYLLLKEKSEQEQNLLRLLVNKLGDTDRAVASKASNSLLNILNVHPNMKSVITNEVSSLVMRPSFGLDSEGKPKYNSHARYYGILTLNQTMLTSRDEEVANRLVTLYFELFENVLNELNKQAGGREEVAEEKGQEGGGGAEKPKKEKQRWRDGKRGKGKKGQQKVAGPEESKVIQDSDAKTMAAILAGVRRALPFARVDGAIFEKHMTTLFRITHSSTFNISIQALQLIYQVSVSSTGASTSSQGISTTKIEDRFYRALYASLLDPRLATTSKQAMYLNLLFKAIKSDSDDRRVKAFVKRFVQTLNHGEPPWICGGLFLLGELLTALPGLKTLLEEGEDDGEEHFVDAVEGSDGEPNRSTQPNPTPPQPGYDAAKREPQFAKAETSCLWELTPLLSHFHPSVSLHAHQLLQGQRITTTADLTLNTLAHFLDRFVYRNPKKNVTPSKGASIMQPAMNVNDKGAGLEGGVVKLRGVGIRKDEFVNDEKFWKKKVQEVPVDQLFFHKYFTQRLNRSGDADAVKKERQDLDGDDDDDDGSDVVDESADESKAEQEGDEQDSEEDSEEEREIWKEMKRTMPRVAGDEMLDESEGEEEDDELALMDYDDSDESGEGEEEEGTGEEESGDESEGNMFDEDEDDLLPVDFDQEARGTKRGADEGSDEEEEGDKGQSKSQKRREERKRRKAMPAFASAEEYAHLLGNSDEEDVE